MAEFPDWLEPMAATLTQDRFAADGWVFEQKIDGIRLLTFKHSGGVRLQFRAYSNGCRDSPLDQVLVAHGSIADLLFVRMRENRPLCF